MFAHSAFRYGDDASYASALALFVREGLARDQAVAIAAAPDRLALLRDALAGDASSVRFLPADEWYARPLRTIAGWARLLRPAPDGRRVRLVGETPWTGSTAGWLRYEAALNRSLARFDGVLLCPYDLRVLPAEIVTAAARTHPRLYEDGWRDSTAFDPARVLAEVPDRPWPVTGAPALAVPITDDVAGLRAVLRQRAHAEGWLPAAQAEYLVLAACELATNSIRHGGADRELTVWVLPDAVVGEVTDRGGRVLSPFAGYLPPVPGVSGGMGLWLVHQLCDTLTLQQHDGVTRARFAMLRTPTPAVRPEQPAVSAPARPPARSG